MSKKSKRQVRKSSPAVSANVPAQASVAAPVSPQAVGPTRLTTPAEFNPDYTYVVKDLRRIGILAASFIVVLIALSFFIK